MEATATVPIPATTEVMTIWARERAMRSRAVGVDQAQHVVHARLCEAPGLVSLEAERSPAADDAQKKGHGHAGLGKSCAQSRALDAEAGSPDVEAADVPGRVNEDKVKDHVKHAHAHVHDAGQQDVSAAPRDAGVQAEAMENGKKKATVQK